MGARKLRSALTAEEEIRSETLVNFAYYLHSFPFRVPCLLVCNLYPPFPDP